MALLIEKREKTTVENTPCEWVDWKDGVKFEIYGIAHPLYLEARAKYERRVMSEDLLNLSQGSGTDLEKQIAIVGQYLIKGWEGFEGDDNKPLEKTAENFTDIVVMFPEIYEFVMNSSVEIQKAHTKAIAEKKK